MNESAVIDRQARTTSGRITIDAPASSIFDLLADPRAHPTFDGSGMLQDNISGPQRLVEGSRFAMTMRLGRLPYRITSTVVEFVENERIAWQHLGKHRWRYELAAIDDRTCLLTETFDWSTALAPWAIERVGYPERHIRSIDATLKRLAGHFAAEGLPGGSH